MPNFAQVAQGTPCNLFETYSTNVPGLPLGTPAWTKDGRRFRWVKAGGVALVVGNVLQSPAIVPDHLAMTPVAAAIGATVVQATLGATLAALNQYAEGLIGVDTTPDVGRSYTISGHKAVDASGVITLTLDPADALVVAWTSATRVGLIANPFNGVIQLPVTTATGSIVGVAQSIIPANGFGWIQDRGLATVLITGTPALGAMVLGPGTAAGAAQVIVAAGNLVVGQLIGRMAQVGVNGKSNFVMLDIG